MKFQFTAFLFTTLAIISCAASPARSEDFLLHTFERQRLSEVYYSEGANAGDINGDGLPDIVVGNKKGTFVHIHETKKVTREEWRKAQPKPLTPSVATAQK